MRPGLEHVVPDVAKHRVHERAAPQTGIDNHQPRRIGSLQCFDDIARGPARGLGHERHWEHLPDDGGDVDHVEIVGAESGEPVPDQLAHRPAAMTRRRHLAQEQRVPAGVLYGLFDVDRAPQLGEQCGGRSDVESCQGDHLDARHTDHRPEEALERFVEIGGGVAGGGQDHEGRPGRGAGEPGEHVSCRVRRPVQILDHEQRGVGVRHLGQVCVQCDLRRVAFVHTVDDGRGGQQAHSGTGGGDDPSQALFVAVGAPPQLEVGDRGQVVGEHLHEWLVRHLRAVGARAEQHSAAAAADRGGEVRGEARLSDAGLPGDDGHARAVRGRPVPPGEQSSGLVASSDERATARQGTYHRWEPVRRRGVGALPGEACQLRAVASAELVHQGRYVALDCPFRQAQRCCDLGIRGPVDERVEHVGLAAGHRPGCHPTIVPGSPASSIPLISPWLNAATGQMAGAA